MSSPLRKRMRSPAFRAALSAGLPAQIINKIIKNWIKVELTLFIRILFVIV